MCYPLTGTGRWRDVAQRVFQTCCSALRPTVLSQKDLLDWDTSAHVRKSQPCFFQGLWVTGKRPSRYLKRAALRIVHRREEATALAS